MVRSKLLFTVVALVVLTGAQAALGAVALRLDKDALSATGLTPGGEAVVFGLSYQMGSAGPWTVRVVPWRDVIPDRDRDGAILHAPDGGVSPMSVWAVVDLASGEFAVSRPPESPFEEVTFDAARGVGRSAFGKLRRVRTAFDSMHLLAVRPKVGAWSLVAADGGPGDRGAADDRLLESDLEDAVALGTHELGFDELREGDVLIGIDPHRLRFFAVRFADALEGESR